MTVQRCQEVQCRTWCWSRPSSSWKLFDAGTSAGAAQRVRVCDFDSGLCLRYCDGDLGVTRFPHEPYYQQGTVFELVPSTGGTMNIRAYSTTGCLQTPTAAGLSGVWVSACNFPDARWFLTERPRLSSETRRCSALSAPAPASVPGPHLTTVQGVRLPDTDHSLKAGPRGPSLMEDFMRLARARVRDYWSVHRAGRSDHEKMPSIRPPILRCPAWHACIGSARL